MKGQRASGKQGLHKVEAFPGAGTSGFPSLRGMNRVFLSPRLESSVNKYIFRTSAC